MSNKKPTDTEMLNWLDQQGQYYRWHVKLSSDYPPVKYTVFVCRNTTNGAETIREAITEAMEKQKGKA